MTIKNSIRKKLRRFALFCLVAASTSAVYRPSQLQAEDTHDSIAMQVNDTLHDDSELCGWVDDLTKTVEANPVQPPSSITKSSKALVPHFLTITVGKELIIDTCNYEKWLQGTLKDLPSIAAAKVAPQSADFTPAPTKSTQSSRTASDFNAAVAAIVAAASSGTPVPFTHWTEPFAMVGPTYSTCEVEPACGDVTTDFAVVEASDVATPTAEVLAFKQWLTQTQSFIGQLDLDDFAAFVAEQQASLAVAAEENVLASEGVLAIVETTPIQEEPNAAVVAHLGTAPLIFTIEEAFASYDMAEEDLVAEVFVAPIDEHPELIVASLADTSQADVLPKNEQADKAEQAEHVVTNEADIEIDVVTDAPKLVWMDTMLSPNRQPLCFRSFAEQCEAGWSPKADQAVPSWQRRLLPAPVEDTLTQIVKSETMTAPIEAVAESTTVPTTEPVALIGSPECWLDELIGKADQAARLQQRVSQSLRPHRMGSHLASLVVSGDEAASEFAVQLAQVWPAAPAPVNPIVGSGVKLLARAEAAEQIPGVAR